MLDGSIDIVGNLIQDATLVDKIACRIDLKLSGRVGEWLKTGAA